MAWQDEVCSSRAQDGAKPMLVLTRKRGEQIVVPEFQLTLTVLDITRSRVRVGISAPPNVAVQRAELLDREISRSIAGSDFPHGCVPPG